MDFTILGDYEMKGMNNNKLVELMLLKDSGEISPSQQQELDRLLADGSEKRETFNEMDGFLDLFRSTDKETALDPHLRARILALGSDRIMGSNRQGRVQALDNAFKLWRPAIMSAAVALFLFFAILPLYNHVNRGQQPVKEGSAWIVADDWELDLQLLILNEDVTWAYLDYASIADMDKDIDDIAYELMQLTEAGI